MSMLAERKRKQKLSLNPRGNLWKQDTNSFGMKMLQRMGWKEGKGLGKNEDGDTSHIKVKYKNDSNGLGMKDTDQASVHQDDFNSLLSELSKTEGDIKKPQELKSLEAKSQNSRARVHYKKFTRGKDLSRYSEKDLANIFGKKKLHADPPEIKEVEIIQETEEETFGVQVIQGGCMNSYFKSKMEKLENRNGFRTHFKTELQAFEENGCEAEHADKNKKLKKESFVSYVCENEVNGDVPQKKKKRKHLGEQAEEAVTPKKHKKDKNLKQEEEDLSATSKKFKESEYLGLINPAFEPLGINVTVNKHKLATITETVDENEELEVSINEEKSKKKKKKNACQEFNETLEESSVVYKSKSSKKKKQKTNEGLENPAFELLNGNDNQGTANENESEDSSCKENSKKKKKKSKKHSGIENPSFAAEDQENSIIAEENSYEENSKKKKSKLKNGIENPSFAVEDQENSTFAEENPYEETSKKKKSKQKSGIENPSFDAQDQKNATIAEDNPYEEKPKMKKKKSSSFAIDNPTFNINDDSEPSQLSEQYEVKRKGKKKSKGVDNPALDLNNPQSDTSVMQNGLHNGTANSVNDIPDCDIMINVVDVPVKATPKTTPANRSKSFRFSNVNLENSVAKDESPEDASKRKNELFAINTKVIQESLRRQKKLKRADSHGFDISSDSKLGQDNQGYDEKAQQVEESLNKLSNALDSYQAEVENSINESKLNRNMLEDLMVGEINDSDGDNEPHEEGVKLRFKFARFNQRVPVWTKSKDLAATWPKKTYKHLIRGDIIVGFKNTSLHKIHGYGHRNTPGF